MDVNTQGESQSPIRTKRSISNLLQAMKDLPWSQRQFSPGRVFAITIVGIALAEILEEVITTAVVNYIGHLSYGQHVLLDAIVVAAIIFPWLYFLSFKPFVRQIQQRKQSESIIQARLRLVQFATTHSLDELLQFSLDEIEALTGATIGFFHFFEADQNKIWLQAWSSNTLQYMCNAEVKDNHYDVELAGVWADAVRYRQPIIHNNYAALPDRKEMPEGHPLVIREMVIPILRNEKVMAILGLGNKPQDFTAKDVEIVSTFADFAWVSVEHKRAENALHQSEEKFRTLVDWTYDWENWMDPHGNIVYTTPSCERITGYLPEEFIADPDLLIRIVHPDDRQSYQEHQKIIHDAMADPIVIEYRIISRDGSELWIEHTCRPLFAPDGQYLGRRVSLRDITEWKQTETKIIEQSQKEEVLTRTIQTIQTDIARDLHDTLGQNIGYLRMNLEHLSETQWNAPTNIKIQIQSMSKAANEAYELIRAELVMLHSGNSDDPLDLFTHYAQQVAERSSFQIDITRQGTPKQLSPSQIRQLFFIFREALTNTEKYADAGRVSVEFISDDDALNLVISDNGCGFDPDAVQNTDHYGIKIMRARAELLKGSVLVKSAIGQGTMITVVVPYDYLPVPLAQ